VAATRLTMGLDGGAVMRADERGQGYQVNKGNQQGQQLGGEGASHRHMGPICQCHTHHEI
jgi:hypothetical protein